MFCRFLGLNSWWVTPELTFLRRRREHGEGGWTGEAPVLVFERLALGLCVPLPAAHHQLAPAAGVLLHLVRPRHGHTGGDQRGPRHEHQHLASISIIITIIV